MGDRRIASTPYALVAQEAASAATLGGLPPSAFQQHYKNVVIVAKSGGDYTTISDALTDITGTAENPYLVWVAPGTYTELVTMKPYVDIAGAGELLTRIMLAGTGTGIAGTVACADDAELRDLTVESTGGNYAIAIRCDSASPRLSRVTAKASGGAVGNYGVYNNNSSPAMAHVTASASGGVSNYGVHNISSSPAMNDVSATAWGNTPGAGDSNVYNYGVSNVTSSSPAMNGVAATASGHAFAGSYVYNYGILNDASSPTMNQVTAAASGDNGGGGAVANYGVYSGATTTPVTMNGVTATASGSRAANIGIESYNSSLTIRNSAIQATEGTSNIGVSTYRDTGSGYVVEISNSHVEAITNTISQYWDFTIRVAASQLSGGDITFWTLSFACVGVYDESFLALSNTCQ